MSETSVSLLERLRRQPDAASWQRLVDLHTPLIQGWLRRHLLPGADTDDLMHEVLAVVVCELPRLEHSRRPGAFWSWPRTITAHRLADFWWSRHSRLEATGDSRCLPNHGSSG
jgi:DNA-directed RNA polymerase specialized sigma24 family protein